MAKGASKNRQKSRQQQQRHDPKEVAQNSQAARTSAPPVAPIPDGLFFLGMLLMIIACAVTGVLVANHLGSLSLPGCRPGGACEQAAASAWGKLPGTNWPISFVGLAYFVGILFAWLTSKGGISPQLRYVVRIGALISVMYVVVLIVNRHACYYCIGAHAANLLFWLMVERLQSSPAAAWRPVVTTAAVFLLASAALGATEWQGKKAEEQRQEDALAESTREIIEASEKAKREAEARKEAEATGEQVAQDSSPSQTGTISVVEGEANAADRPWQGGFTGRYRWGPEEAAVRIVMITDYQCPDCRRAERDLTMLMNARSDVSVTVKHFPFCTDCNPGVGRNMHPNACWAARAAETAGILRGAEGFWEMHKWLFDQKGGFTNTEFRELLERLGYDERQFTDVMQSKITLELVQKDIQEAIWLGLHYTPMIFLNGKELKGVFAHEALSRAVLTLLATNPTPATCENDQPPPAAQKYIDDWREGEMRMPGEDVHAWPMGVEGAALHVVLWGDFQEPNTARADRIIRDFMAGRSDCQYLFRHYPVNQLCNRMSQLTKHPNACRMAQAAEAAGLLFGTDGYWKMHDWLMNNQETFSDEALREACRAMGFLPDALFVKMGSEEVAQGIAYDADVAKRLGLTSIPYIYVNQRFVPRWHREGDNMLQKIMQAALEEGTKAGK